MHFIFVLIVISLTKIIYVTNEVYCWHIKSWRDH